MADTNSPLTPGLLLEHAAWLRRLAGHLVREGTEADDMLQETWEAALASPPDPGRPARPWLARVLANAVRSASRSSARRTARERGLATPDEMPTAEDLLARMQLQEQLARL
jgi:DNA-directed RNA polymerase specialized sigma24 family protein